MNTSSDRTGNGAARGADVGPAGAPKAGQRPDAQSSSSWRRVGEVDPRRAPPPELPTREPSPAGQLEEGHGPGLELVSGPNGEELPRCDSAQDGLRCERWDGHPPGEHRGYCPRARRVVEWSTRPIAAVEPWRRKDHTFPHRRITTKVMRAQRRAPRCDREGRDPPRGHVERIALGEPYLRVSLRPDRGGGSGRWRSRNFCRACALDYGLVTEGGP